MHRLALFVGLVLASAGALAGSTPAAAQAPGELAGTWSAHTVVTSRSHPPGGDYIFTRDTVTLRFEIAADGGVTGVVGDAVLVEGTLRRNRGWPGRLLRMKTDYIIRGRLTGEIFARDTITDRHISAPFNLRDGAMHGTLFHLQGVANLNLYPMAELNLRRLPAP